jgi:hypothetical protein
MALLSGFNEIQPSTQTFSDWLNKTNELILITRGDTTGAQTSMMTANGLPGGSLTYGNATLFGQFAANAVVVFNDGRDPSINAYANGLYGGLRGGTFDFSSNDFVSDTLYVTTNTTFTDETVEVYVDSTYGLIVENNIEARYDVLFVGDGPSGTNTNPQMHWQSSNNQLNFNDNVRATFGGATGTEVFGGTGQLEMFYDAGRMYANTDNLDIRAVTDTNFITDNIEVKSETGAELYITADVADNSTVKLYYEGDVRLSTNTYGVVVHGDTIIQDDAVIFDNNKILMGGTYPYNGGEDIATYNFQLYTDGTDGIIVSGDRDLNIFVHEGFNLTDEPGTTKFITANNDGSSEVVLYNNGDARLETTGTQAGEVPGVEVFGEANTTTLRVRQDANFDNDTLNSNSVHWDATSEVWNYRDSVKATFGDSDDWEMFYTAAGRAYSNTDNQDIRARTDLNVITDTVEIKSESGSELYMSANVADNSTVRLYYEGVERLQTNTHGVEVTGELVANGGIVTYNNQPIEMGGADYAADHNFTIVTDGTDSFVTETTNDLFMRVEDNFRVTDDTGTTSLIVANTSGEVTLYHNNISKLQTNTAGIEVYGEANTVTLRVQEDAYFDGSAGLDADSLVWESSNNTLSFEDDVYAAFGTDEDLRIYHTGSASYVDEQGTGSLIVRSTNLLLTASDDTRYIAAIDGDRVEYYSPNANTIEMTINNAGLQIVNDANTNTLRVRSTALFEDDAFFDGTTVDALHWDSSEDLLNFNDGIKATFGTSNDLQIFHEVAGDSIIKENGPGSLRLQANNLILEDTAGNDYILGTAGDSVAVTHAGNVKFETSATGATVTGTLVADGVTVGDNEIIQLGTTMQLYNDGSASVVTETGTGSLVLQGNNIVLEDTAGTNYIRGVAGAAVEVTHAGSVKLTTTSTGINVTGETNTDTLLVSSTSQFENDITILGTLGNLEWDKSEDALRFDDGQVLTFGDTVDLSIKATGTGNVIDALQNTLLIRQFGNNLDVAIQSDDSTGGVTDYVRADGSTGSVLLSHYGTTKLQTISTGITVTGDVGATTFTGSGASLTNLNATALTTGTVNDARLPAEISSNISGTAAQSNTIQMHTSTTNANQPVVFAGSTSGYQDARGDTTFTFNPNTNTLTVDNLVVDDSASLPDGLTLSGNTIFENLYVSNTAIILNLEVSSLEANGVAFTGTGGDVTSTAATVIDSFEVGQTQGFKYFVHGENLSDADSGYAVEVNIIVTDNKDIYYTRYGEVDSNIGTVSIVPVLAANTTHIDLRATCSDASITNVHRFKVLKIETRA